MTLPARSLGWALLDWYAEWLRIPSGPNTGAELVLTDEQASFVVRWYEVDDTGRRVHRRAASRRPKGWGKSPLLAAMAIGELCGPVTFAGWDKSAPLGVAHPSPWVQIAAVSEDQTDNTYVALFEMLRESPAVPAFGIDLGQTRVHLHGRPGRIEPVTAAAGSREGQPVTFAVLDETHLWLPGNGGTKMAETLRRNVGKMGGGSIESTNAFIPGLDSVAERTEAAAAKPGSGILLDNGPRVPKVTDISDREQMLPALQVAYGDSHWVDLERIFAEANDPDTGEDNARRFYLNDPVASSGQWIAAAAWRARGTGERPAAGEQIALGFDGSKFNDSTALIGCRLSDGLLFVIDIWEKPDGPAGRDWRVPEADVDATVARTFEEFRVARMYCDPPYWESYVDVWRGRHGDKVVLEWWTNRDRAMAYALRRVRSAVADGTLAHDNDPRLARHVANARTHLTTVKDENGELMPVIRKDGKNSPRKIDAAVAMALAAEARGDAVAAGALNDTERSNEFAYF